MRGGTDMDPKIKAKQAKKSEREILSRTCEMKKFVC